MRLVRPLLVLALPLSLLAACGGDDDEGGEGAGATTTTTGEPGTTAPSTEGSEGDGRRSDAELAADQALADGIVLTREDVGPGWTASEEDESDEEPEEDTTDELFDAEFAECLDVDPEVLGEEADDPEATTSFEQEVSSIESSAFVAATASELDPAFEAFGKEQFPDCFEKVFEAEMEADPEPGVAFTGIEAEALGVPDAIGDDGIAFRVTLTATAEGVSFDTYMDMYIFRRGRVGLTLFALNVFEPPDQEQTGELLELMYERAAGA